MLRMVDGKLSYGKWRMFKMFKEKVQRNAIDGKHNPSTRWFSIHSTVFFFPISIELKK